MMKHQLWLTQQFRVAILAVVTVIVVVGLWPRIVAIQLSEFDFYHFWAAAEVARAGTNPYTEFAFLYPPWVIPFFLPFGFFTFNTSRWLWYFIQIGLLFWVFSQAWSIVQGQKKLLWLAWGAGLVFSATIFTLILGQLSLIVLAGMLLFLNRIEKKNFQLVDYLGLSLGGYLISLKPQTFYLFWLFLLLWGVAQKQWKVLLVCVSGILTASVLVTAIFPDVFPSYFYSLVATPFPIIYRTPTIGYWLRFLLGVESFGLQFIAPILGIILALFYWRRNRALWRWPEQVSAVAFLTVLTAPHAWTHDQLILLPAIFQGLAIMVQKRSIPWLIVYLFAWVTFNAVVIGLHFNWSDFWFIWQLPIIFIFYWFPRRFGQVSNAEIPPVQDSWSKK